MYYLFIWEQYYPNGGFNDFHQSSNSISDLRDGLMEYMTLHHMDYYQIVQITKEGWNTVEEGKCNA